MSINVILLYKDIYSSIAYMIDMINILTDLISILVTNTYDFICIMHTFIHIFYSIVKYANNIFIAQ